MTLPGIADARPPPLMGRLVSDGFAVRERAPHQGSWPSLRGLRGPARVPERETFLFVLPSTPLDIKTHTYTGWLTAAALCLSQKCACETHIHPLGIELYAVEIQKDFLSKQLQKLQTT